MRRVLAGVLALLAACGRNAPSPVSTPTKPRLVVLVVIDQWPSWVFAKQRHLFTGGIGRLVREGAVVPAAEIPYANTFTAVGHATLATGAMPRVHGILGNYWHRRGEGRDRPAEFDPDALPHAVGEPFGDPVTADDGASGRSLRVDGVADVLRETTGGTGKSVAISLKSRSACLVAGKQPDLAIWYESGAGGMTTSAAYARGLPRWLAEHATTHPANRYFGSTWTARDPALLARETGLVDGGPGEASNYGLDDAFPHSLADTQRPERALQETPFADQLVAHTVAAALDALQLGRDDVADLLAISFSAHDYAGHAWGPDSWEVLDLTLRLDATLGELFEMLDARLGSHGWAAVVTSDHGATPVVERSGIPSARRIAPREIEDTARTALETHLNDETRYVVHVVSGNLYITPSLAALPLDVRGPALEAVAGAVGAMPGIAYAGRGDLLSKDCADEQDELRAICHSQVAGASGELYVYPRPGSVITPHKTGTGHDAPSDATRRVPILVKAPGVLAQQGTGSLLQVAPTLAALLGVPPPPAASEPALFGIKRVD